MIKTEFKKIFIKNKMIVLFLTVIVFSIFTQFNANTYKSFTFDSEQDFYMSCMEKLYGKSDSNKLKSIEKIKYDYNKAKLSKKSSDLSTMGAVVEKLSSCEKYVKQNPERHFFIDYTGWTQVFQTFGFDFLILLFVLPLSVSSVMIEFNADMTVINSVSKKGRSIGAASKLFVVLISTFLLVLLVAFIHIVIYSEKYDLTGWDFPLESLKAYSGSTKELSIGAAYLTSVAIKAFGYCSFAVFTMFFTILFKKAVPSMAVSVSTVLAPMYIFNSALEGQIRFFLPLPIGAIISTGYLRGTEKVEFSDSYLFREIGVVDMALIFGALLFLSALMMIFISRRLSGRVLRLKLRKKSVLFAMCIITTVFSSCGAEDFTEKPSQYVISDLDTVTSKNDGEEIKLNEIPTDKPCELGFVSGAYAYAKSDKTIFKINLKTLEKTELLSVGKNIDKTAFLGLEDLVPDLSVLSIDTTSESLSNLVGGHKDNLYFSSLNGIVEYNAKTGTIRKVLNDY